MLITMKSYSWVLLSFICFTKFCNCCDLAPINQDKLAVKVLWKYTPNANTGTGISEFTTNVIRSVCDNVAKFGTAMTLELHIFSYVHKKNGVIECEPTKSCKDELWEACAEVTNDAVAIACCTNDWDTCIKNLNANEQKIDECFDKGMNGPGGQRLLASRQVIDNAGVQEPPEGTITFNDQFNQCTAKTALKNFVHTACALYKPEVKPTTACSP